MERNINEFATLVNSATEKGLSYQILKSYFAIKNLITPADFEAYTMAKIEAPAHALACMTGFIEQLSKHAQRDRFVKQVLSFIETGRELQGGQ